MPVTRSSVPAEPAPRVAAVILAGGEGRRMGGVDKGLVEFAGGPLIARVIARLAPQVACWSISANRSLATYRALAGGAVFEDASGYAGAGPLAGIEAALTRLSAGHGGPPADWLLVVPCDTPLLPTQLVVRLLAAVEAGTEVVYACDPLRGHPTVALLRAGLGPRLRSALDDGIRAVLDFYARCETRRVAFTDPAAFANLNTPAQLAALEHELRRRPRKQDR